MLNALGLMVLLIALGALFRFKEVGGLCYDNGRKVLTTLVYYIFLPALILSVMSKHQPSLTTLKIILCSASGVLMGVAVAWLVYRRTTLPAKGALVLASAWGNATYMGIPFLSNTLGEHTTIIALTYDLLAHTPLLLTLGISIAIYCGSNGQSRRKIPWSELLRIPPLWAAVIAMALASLGVALPESVLFWCQTLGAAVVPLMLIALGMSLPWQALHQLNWRLYPAALIIQLLLLPIVVTGVAYALGVSEETFQAVVLEAAMPSMVLGLVICDRYHLQTEHYAAVVCLSTLVSMVTLPVWYALLS
ncbi:MAG: transporter [Kangiellaceae bacterium]|nr:transporter [Kangiellaceae bacterium]|tara:strand:+ start:5476 stop:6390 length:915 start_codon:yes stop_codon:yes gene_type:complete